MLRAALGGGVALGSWNSDQHLLVKSDCLVAESFWSSGKEGDGSGRDSDVGCVVAARQAGRLAVPVVRQVCSGCPYNQVWALY